MDKKPFGDKNPEGVFILENFTADLCNKLIMFRLLAVKLLADDH
jgi:hypothetical protein